MLLVPCRIISNSSIFYQNRLRGIDRRILIRNFHHKYTRYERELHLSFIMWISSSPAISNKLSTCGCKYRFGSFKFPLLSRIEENTRGYSFSIGRQPFPVSKSDRICHLRWEKKCIDRLKNKYLTFRSRQRKREFINFSTV